MPQSQSKLNLNSVRLLKEAARILHSLSVVAINYFFNFRIRDARTQGNSSKNHGREPTEKSECDGRMLFSKKIAILFLNLRREPSLEEWKLSQYNREAYVH